MSPTGRKTGPEAGGAGCSRKSPFVQWSLILSSPLDKAAELEFAVIYNLKTFFKFKKEGERERERREREERMEQLQSQPGKDTNSDF